MIRGNELPAKDDISTVPIPRVTALFMGAFAGAAVWLVIYRICPKPPWLDKFLDWWFAGRPGPRERPNEGNGAGAPTINTHNNPNGIERQGLSARRPASPTETIETIMSGSELSTPEPPMLVTSDEDSE